MAVSIDNTILYRNYNTLKLVAPANFKCYPFQISGMEHISHGFYVYSTSDQPNAVRAVTRFIGSNGITISKINHSFSVQRGVFTWQKIEAVPVPTGAKFAKLELLNNTSGSTYWAGLIKTEHGQLATDFTQNFSGQLTLITASGIYTGTIQANQIMITNNEDLINRLTTINDKFLNISQWQTNRDGTINAHTAQLSALGLDISRIEGSVGSTNTVLTQIRAGNINLSANTGGSIGSMNISQNTLRSTNGNYGVQISGHSGSIPIWVGNSSFNNPVFQVTWQGKMISKDADIEGNITAKSGTIGGFNIQSNTLESGSSSGTRYVRITGNANLNPIQIMRNGNMMFFVDTNGKLTAKDADIEGKISANEGTIGGWNITNSFIDSKNGNARVYLASHADIASTFLGITDSNGVTQFSVTKQGHLVANSATIKGTLQAGSIINGQLNSTSGTHSGSLYNVSGTYTGGLVNTTGTHTGYTTGRHSGSLYSTSGNHAGSLTNTTGSHNGSIYSSTGTLAGVRFKSDTNYLDLEGTVQMNSLITRRGIYVFGDIQYQGNLTKASDERLKQDIEDIPQNITDELMNVKIKRFAYKTNPNEKHFGVLAQDLISDTSRNMSDVLVKPYEGYFTVAYEQFVPLLIKKVQDQEKRIKELEEKTA